MLIKAEDDQIIALSQYETPDMLNRGNALDIDKHQIYMFYL